MASTEADLITQHHTLTHPKNVAWETMQRLCTLPIDMQSRFWRILRHAIKFMNIHKFSRGWRNLVRKLLREYRRRAAHAIAFSPERLKSLDYFII